MIDANEPPPASDVHATDFVVLCHSFVDAEMGRAIIGGTQTYTRALSQLAATWGGRTLVLQGGSRKFALEEETGIQVRSWTSSEDLQRELRGTDGGRRRVTFLFNLDFLPGRSDQPTVFVQHGIYHDGGYETNPRGRALRAVADLNKLRLHLEVRRDYFKICTRSTRVVCVDTNFVNYMRASFPQFDWGDRLEYLPNFADPVSAEAVDRKWEAGAPRRVLFARRFVHGRGAFLWMDVVKELAPAYPSVEFRIVGAGQPGEAILRSCLGQHSNVKIYERPYARMPQEHLEAHISVAPSLWSEGTSLSCVEAMAAGCAMVATHVGGIPDLVVPNYNGLLVPPVVNRVRSAVVTLLENPELARTFGRRSHAMACASFSTEAWRIEMARVVREVLARPMPSRLRRRIAHPAEAGFASPATSEPSPR